MLTHKKGEIERKGKGGGKGRHELLTTHPSINNSFFSIASQKVKEILEGGGEGRERNEVLAPPFDVSGRVFFAVKNVVEEGGKTLWRKRERRRPVSFQVSFQLVPPVWRENEREKKRGNPLNLIYFLSHG